MSDITDNLESDELTVDFDEFENFLNSDEVSNIFEDKQEPYFESQTVEGGFDETGSVNNEMIMSEPVYDDGFQEEVITGEPVYEDSFQEEVITGEPVYDESFQEEVITVEPVYEESFQEEVIAGEPVYEDSFQEEIVAVDPVMVEDMSDDSLSSEYSFDDKMVSDVDDRALGGESLGFDVISSDNLKYLKWYSGNSIDNVYEFGKSSKSAEFVGSDSCNTIHVNVGYDTYGWNVSFSDGTVMNLRDVREYQIRNGSLPSNSGQILYGQNVLSFENVDRIVIYETVKYFSYGV